MNPRDSNYLPAAFLRSLEGLPGYHAQDFLATHLAGATLTSVRLNLHKLPTAAAQAAVLDALSGAGALPVPWCGAGYYLPRRPSFTMDPYFHAGTYYVQEASSMFLEHAVRSLVPPDAPLRVLDLCAAPGGKSTLLQSLLPANSLLVANEVIKPRAALLADNITKWGAANVVVTNNDPRDFTKLEGYFDLVVADAPCSGSGLFRRDPEAVGAWSPESVILCSQRQQRILADIVPAVKAGGTLIYSTCSYAREEDEDIMDWLLENFDLEPLPLQVPAAWNIVTTESPVRKARGYRFYPDQVRGEGFFLACFRKTAGPVFSARNQRVKAAGLPPALKQAVMPYLQSDDLFLWPYQQEVLALPPALAPDVTLLQQQLYLRKAGVNLGQPTPKELIPDHALALSNIVAKSLPGVSLNKREALQYLRREDFRPETPVKGWALMAYEGHAVGWAKLLPNRVNNYYPKNLRVLKEISRQDLA